MFKNLAIFMALWGLSTSQAKGDEGADLLAKRSELQREKEEIQKIDLQIIRVTTTWQRISSDFQTQASLLQSNLASIEKLAAAQSSEMDRLSKWMTDKYEIVKTASDSAVFRSLMEEYRTLRMGNGCRSSGLDDQFRAVVGNLDGMRNLKNEAADLDKNWNLPPDFDEMRKAIRDGTEVLSVNFESAKKSVTAVMPLMLSSDVCDAFLQFDVVISLSQTIAEVNKAASSIDAIDFTRFLKDIDNLDKERNLLKQVRRVATSMGGRNITNIRLGKLGETLQFAATYQNQIDALSTSLKSLKFVGDAERNQAMASLNNTTEDMAKELENSKVFTTAGKRTFLLTRAQNVQTRLFKLNSMQLDSVKADLYQKVKSYCQTEISMTPTGRYLLPANLGFEQSIKLDEKFAKAQEMLQKIDGVEI
jgi:hypothetical protein